MQLEPRQVAAWHAWQWFQRGLDTAKPKGRTNAIKNRWKRLNQFCDNELRVAEEWCERIRNARRRAEVDAEFDAAPTESMPAEFELNFQKREN